MKKCRNVCDFRYTKKNQTQESLDETARPPQDADRTSSHGKRRTTMYEVTQNRAGPNHGRSSCQSNRLPTVTQIPVRCRSIQFQGVGATSLANVAKIVRNIENDSPLDGTSFSKEGFIWRQLRKMLLQSDCRDTVDFHEYCNLLQRNLKKRAHILLLLAMFCDDDHGSRRHNRLIAITPIRRKF